MSSPNSPRKMALFLACATLAGAPSFVPAQKSAAPAAQPAPAAATQPANTPAAQLDRRLEQIGKMAESTETWGEGNEQRMLQADRVRSAIAVSSLRQQLEAQDLRAARTTVNNIAGTVSTTDFRLLWQEASRLVEVLATEQRNAIPRTIEAEVRQIRSSSGKVPTAAEARAAAERLTALQNMLTRMGNEGGNQNYQLAEILRALIADADAWSRAAEADEAGDPIRALGVVLQIVSSGDRGGARDAFFVNRDVTLRHADAMQQKVLKRLDDLIADAGAEVAKGGTPESLQKTLDNFQRRAKSLQPSSSYSNYSGNTGNEFMQEFSRKTLRAAATIDWWSRVLTQEAGGRPRAALTALNGTINVSGRTSSYYTGSGSESTNAPTQDLVIVTRKQTEDKRAALQTMIMDEAKNIREPDLKRIVDVIDEAKTLDDMLNVNAKLGVNWETTLLPMFDNQTLRGELVQAGHDLRRLASARQALEARQFRVFWRVVTGPSTPQAYRTRIAQPNPMGGPPQYVEYMPPAPNVVRHRWSDRIAQQMTILGNQAIAQSMDLGPLPEKLRAAPSDEAMLQIADEAAKARDYLRVLRALDAYQMVLYSESDEAPAWLRADMDACRLFIAAENLKSAGQVREAARHYLAALATPARRTPAAVAAAKLEELKKIDAAAVNLGAEDFRNQPRPEPYLPQKPAPVPPVGQAPIGQPPMGQMPVGQVPMGPGGPMNRSAVQPAPGVTPVPGASPAPGDGAD